MSRLTRRTASPRCAPVARIGVVGFLALTAATVIGTASAIPAGAAQPGITLAAQGTGLQLVLFGTKVTGGNSSACINDSGPATPNVANKNSDGSASLCDGLAGIYSASEGEGFSNTIGEAMACGVRMVVTDVGDSADIVAATGLVVPSGDVDGLARAIHEGLDPTVSTRPLPRYRIEKFFSIDTMVHKTEQLCRELRRPLPRGDPTRRVARDDGAGSNITDDNGAGTDECPGTDTNPGE